MTSGPPPPAPPASIPLKNADAPARGAVALSTRGLNVWYGDSLAVRDVNLDIPARRVTALIGPSGCGKSTLLRCFNRMNELIPGARVEGSVLLDGLDVRAPAVSAASLRRRVGMVFQKPNPFPKSIYENVAWGARINGLASRGAALDAVVERALRRAALWDEVKDKLSKSGQSLSGGQQQRLCIARTIAIDPEVILMDEPCSALDPIATAKVEELMRELAERYTIVIVTHNMEQAARASSMTACMMLDEEAARAGRRTGVVVEFGPTGELFTNPRDRRTEDYITGRVG